VAGAALFLLSTVTYSVTLSTGPFAIRSGDGGPTYHVNSLRGTPKILEEKQASLSEASAAPEVLHQDGEVGVSKSGWCMSIQTIICEQIVNSTSPGNPLQDQGGLGGTEGSDRGLPEEDSATEWRESQQREPRDRQALPIRVDAVHEPGPSGGSASAGSGESSRGTVLKKPSKEGLGLWQKLWGRAGGQSPEQDNVQNGYVVRLGAERRLTSMAEHEEYQRAVEGEARRTATWRRRWGLGGAGTSAVAYCVPSPVV
jgi:hypothetical protein